MFALQYLYLLQLKVIFGHLIYEVDLGSHHCKHRCHVCGTLKICSAGYFVIWQNGGTSCSAGAPLRNVFAPSSN